MLQEMPGRPAASRFRRRHAAQRQMHRLVAVAVLGAVLFAVAGGFTGSVRIIDPLPLQIDAALAAAGFGINEVTLSGHRNTTDGEIYTALGLENAGSILLFDAKAARLRIEGLPWVRTADVVRILPDKLKIHLTERRPSAIWEHDGGSRLVDPSGRVLANLAGGNLPVLGLTRISGTGAPRAFGRLLAALEPHSGVLSRLEIARRIGERRWTLELAGGVAVHLPADREGEALLRLARQHERSGLLDKGDQVVDLRQDGIIAVRASPATAPAARAPGIRSLL